MHLCPVSIKVFLIIHYLKGFESGVMFRMVSTFYNFINVEVLSAAASPASTTGLSHFIPAEDPHIHRAIQRLKELLFGRNKERSVV